MLRQVPEIVDVYERFHLCGLQRVKGGRGGKAALAERDVSGVRPRAFIAETKRDSARQSSARSRRHKRRGDRIDKTLLLVADDDGGRVKNDDEGRERKGREKVKRVLLTKLRYKVTFRSNVTGRIRHERW
jgi:hypothetical protein